MPRVSKVEGGQFSHIFYCPGCGNHHGIIDGRWTFNGDLEKPTITPSILVRGTEWITDEEHELIMSGQYVEPRPYVCHSFVTDGQIQYLNDCTHELAGQTVDIPDIDEI